MRKRRPYEVVLPDGKRVSLDRPFADYTLEELAAIGITPGMGSATVGVMPSERRRFRRRAYRDR